jgi:arsenate reductase (thioredoxin)
MMGICVGWTSVIQASMQCSGPERAPISPRGETVAMEPDAKKKVVFVCQHGALRSRIAAAYFNAMAPPGWCAVSAGVTPQSEVSTRVDPLMAGSDAMAFVDREPPRHLAATPGARMIAIDANVPGAELWSTGGASDESDERLRDEIHDRVRDLVRRGL